MAFEELDAAVKRVAAHKDAWLNVDAPTRAKMLRTIAANIGRVAPRWAELGCAIKGIPATDVMAGEEWVVGPMITARNARLLAETLDAVAATGAPPKPRTYTRPDGQVVARVFPSNMIDRAIYARFRAEVWIERGKPATQGAVYRSRPEKGKVALVLGGGNVSSIPPMDVLYKLFAEDEVVVLKMNPVNTRLAPVFEEALKPLVDEGFLAIVEGGAPEGAFLAEHALVDTLHVTGSDRTYDAIVWGGSPEEQATRKASGEQKNARPFSAELGCVTPILVVPGPWSAADMDFQARHVASMVAQNASFNCNAAKVIVVARGWLQRETFLARVEGALARMSPRQAYYPGAEERWRGFVERYPGAKIVGQKGEGVVPWTLLRDVPPRDGEYALTHEAFCGVLAEVTLDANGAEDFLARAVEFANESCWGTLSCGMLVHPTTADEHAAALDRAIASLRYGGIAINAWPAVVYALGVTTWGAFPGHDAKDIQSGVGVVHNTLLFDHPQKSVVHAPFRIRPTPPWFTDHKTLAETGKRLVDLEVSPDWGKVMRVAASAIRG